MKERISDERLVEIYETRAQRTLPKELCRQAYIKVGKLLAARELDDIFGLIAILPDGRFAVQIYRRWVIAFLWVPGQGARELTLQRL